MIFVIDSQRNLSLSFTFYQKFIQKEWKQPDTSHHRRHQSHHWSSHLLPATTQAKILSYLGFVHRTSTIFYDYDLSTFFLPAPLWLSTFFCLNNFLQLPMKLFTAPMIFYFTREIFIHIFQYRISAIDIFWFSWEINQNNINVILTTIQEVYRIYTTFGKESSAQKPWRYGFNIFVCYFVFCRIPMPVPCQ